MTTMITYDGHVAAFVGATRCYLVSPFSERSARDPASRMVGLMCAMAMAIQRGGLPGPYNDERAARFARMILIDDGEFAADAAEDDELLAERFGVPVAEIARKRDDLRGWYAKQPSPGGLSQLVRASRIRLASRCTRGVAAERRSRHRRKRRQGRRHG